MTTNQGMGEVRTGLRRGDVAGQILKLITAKGWNLYYRGPPDVKISIEETIQRGPVDTLETGILYLILPKIDEPTSQDALEKFIEKHQLMPSIIIPFSRFHYYGRVIYQFGVRDEFEDCLIPGQEIEFIGIELQEKEVKLLSRSQTFMPYEVFQEVIRKLRDISDLE